MLSRLHKPGRPISYLVLISLIALIIGIVVAVCSSSHIRQRKRSCDCAIRTSNTENVIGSVWLVNKGLTLLDENLDPV